MNLLGYLIGLLSAVAVLLIVAMPERIFRDERKKNKVVAPDIGAGIRDNPSKRPKKAAALQSLSTAAEKRIMWAAPATPMAAALAPSSRQFWEWESDWLGRNSIHLLSAHRHICH